MKIFTYDLNTQELELNMFLNECHDDIKDVQFLDNKAVVVTKDEFNLEDYITSQLFEAEDTLSKKEYELALLKSYTHIEKEKINGAIEQTETEIKTLKAKIKTSNEWLKKTSSKK